MQGTQQQGLMPHQQHIQALGELSMDYVLAGSNDRMVYLLITVNLVQNAGAAVPIEFRAIIDDSGSMNEPAAQGSTESKNTVLKEGLAKVVEQLPLTAAISVVGFNDSMHRIVLTGTLQQQRAQAIAAIQKITAGGSTKLSDALEHGLLKSQMTGFIRRAHLVTDGNVNVGGAAERRNCVKLAGDPKAPPLWIIGLGADYDPQFLEELAKAGKPGSFYLHVSDAYEYVSALEVQQQLLQSLGQVQNVVIGAQALNGASIEEAYRLTPTNEPVPFDPTGFSYAHGDLDAAGQRMLLKLRVPAQDWFNQGGEQSVHELVRYTVDYQPTGLGPQQYSETKTVTVSADEYLVKGMAANQNVMTTAYTVRGATLTRSGDLSGAITMYTMAGNKTLVDGLQTLASGGLNTNQERALMTRVNTTGGGLDTLSS